MPKFAFKCRNCGHLTEAAAAGERTVPAACSSCGAGVSFNPTTGVKTYDDSNWIVLADLSAAKLKPILKFHAIAKSDVERHKPFPPAKGARAPQSIERSAEETLGAEDHPG